MVDSREIIVKVLKDYVPLSTSEIENIVEVPKVIAQGDFAFPCFALAAKLKKNPVIIAKELASKIENGQIDRVEASGPYVNFFISMSGRARQILGKIEKEKQKYGAGEEKGTVMVEFSQPNTHKAFHVGHIRGTSYGESLARMLEFGGNKVIRANYSGDTGMHIAKWLWAYKKFHSKEKPKKEEDWFARIYVEAVRKLEGNEQGTKEVEEINRKLDARDKELMKVWKETRKLSIDAWKPIYEDLGTDFDVNYFESEMEEEGKKIALELEKKGIALRSDGAVIMDLRDLGLSVWVLLRKDGTVLYSAKDIALAARKFDEYKLGRSITITSSEQDLHFQQLLKTLELMKFPHRKEYEHLSFGSIRLPTGKMSSRTGDNVLYKEFKEELMDHAAKEIKERFPELKKAEVEKRAKAIAIASIKYSMLKQERQKNIIFDKQEALRFEGHTGAYVLYSYARAQSILRKKKAKELEIGEIKEEEKRLLLDLERFEEVVVEARTALAPNTVANYVYELSQKFNEFYHNCPVIGSKEESLRLHLVLCFCQVVENALNLLGIEPIKEM